MSVEGSAEASRLTYWLGLPHWTSSQVQVWPSVLREGKGVKGSLALLEGQDLMKAAARV